MSQVYYISRDARVQEGPFSLAELRAMMHSGQFKPEHLVWTSGMSDWTSGAAQSGLFVEVPPPLPPMAPATVTVVSDERVEAVATGPAGAGAGPDPVRPSVVVQPVVVATANPAFAGFWRRVVATLLDGILILAATAVLTIFLTGGLAFLVAGWLYYALMESSPQQATLGKLALGLRVTDMENRRLDFGRATGRFFSKFLSFFTLCIGFIMAAFSKRKQALHDQVAGTLVLKTA